MIDDLDKMQEIEDIQSILSPLIRALCLRYGRERVVDALRSFVLTSYISNHQEHRDYP